MMSKAGEDCSKQTASDTPVHSPKLPLPYPVIAAPTEKRLRFSPAYLILRISIRYGRHSTVNRCEDLGQSGGIVAGQSRQGASQLEKIRGGQAACRRRLEKAKKALRSFWPKADGQEALPQER